MRKERFGTILIFALILLVCIAAVYFRTPSFLRRVSAVEATASIGLYWDSACSRKLDSIDWGAITLGEQKKVPMYVRNEGNQPFLLNVTLANWQADNTSNCMVFSCERPKVGAGEIVQANPSLLIFSNASEITSFSFNIIFAAVIVTIGDFSTLFSGNPKVTMIYSARALASDWTASAFVFTKLTNATEGYDTQANLVNQTTKRPLGAAGSSMVSFGGPVANPVVKYVENDASPKSDRAPVRFRDDNGTFRFQYQNGSNILGASMGNLGPNASQDFFVIETFSDGDGRYWMLCYGFCWQGTWAAGKYFGTVIFPNLSSHDESWIIVKWDDTNGNGFVNAPADGDTYTVIAKGN